jgi:hypothetical protein
MGALDVCPFIPVQNVTMEECVECAKEFGEKLAIELGVPGKVCVLSPCRAWLQKKEHCVRCLHMSINL